jgi:hypothetical protein
MKLAIMQPYFFPYIGYFQLMNAVDEFVIYNNIKFTKKGWINRNKILVNDQSQYITLPLKKGSDFLPIDKRFLADSWKIERRKLFNRISESYRKSPFFEEVFTLIERCLNFEDDNLFNLIFHSLKEVKGYLKINTPFVISSTIPLNEELKAEKLVIQICKERKTDTYINPIGGLDLYDKSNFKDEGIDLFFLKSQEVSYKQLDNKFIPWLSIIDVMMFNSTDNISTLLEQYMLLSGKSKKAILPEINS